MSSLAVVLDGVILVFLAVTIFYAVRLTFFFKAFRESRESVEALLTKLSFTIDKAQNAIINMQEMSQSSRGDLQDVINEASFLSDELRFMNETGDNLAERLEKLAERNRELVDLIEDHGGIGRPKIKVDASGFNQLDEDVWGLKIDNNDEDIYDEEDAMPSRRVPKQSRAQPSKTPKIDLPSFKQANPKTGFMINDRDYDEDEEDMIEEDTAWSTVLQAEVNETGSTNFTSQAERDLYEALQRQKPRSTSSSKIRESA